MTTYAVQFDKTYVEGLFRGVVVVGEVIRTPDRRQAERDFAFFSKAAASGDLLRDIRGRRYKVSNVELRRTGTGT